MSDLPLGYERFSALAARIKGLGPRNFFSCLFKKWKNSFAALAAGIKGFGAQKIFWLGIFTWPNFLILRTFFDVYSKNGETNILKIFNFEKFILSDLSS